MVLLLAVLVQADPLTGQPVEADQPSFEAYAQLNYLPVYGGDATVGPLSNWGFTGRLAYRVRPGLRVEGLLTHAPRDRDPFHRVPRIDYYGLTAHVSLLSPSAGPELFLVGGVSLLDFGVDEVECRPEDGCFDEGGPTYADGTEMTGIAGLGIGVPMGRSFALLLDGRWHLPRSFSEAGFVGGLGIGMRW